MKYLLLSGHGIKIGVDGGRLQIQDGRTSSDKAPQNFVFRPKLADYDNIVVYGHNGHITFEALRWLVKQNIQLTLLDWNGRLLTSILPIEAKQTELKFKQYRAYESPERLKIAKNLIDAKIRNSKVVLNWLQQKYPQISVAIEPVSATLREARTVNEVMNFEALCARSYWSELSKIIDKKLDFASRLIGKTRRPMGAADYLNCLLNYGYSLLESQCFRAINAAGLDTHVGFLHEVNSGKTPLVYDLQEPFRCLVDVAIVNALEKKVFSRDDFIRTENYNLKLRPSGAKKLIAEFEKVFNTGVQYREGERAWAYVIMLKAQELSLYLMSKRSKIDFTEPELVLERTDDYQLRQKILSIPYAKAKRMGLSKGTLWNMKKNARADKPFKLYSSVTEKISINAD